MIVQHIEVLVEEPSMEQALHLLLPKILLQDISFSIYPHQCKHELLQRLPERLRGYATWLPEDWRILVVIDRDDDDCIALKTGLENFARQAGLFSRSQARNQSYSIVNRLAIEELEAWFFGDGRRYARHIQKHPGRYLYKPNIEIQMLSSAEPGKHLNEFWRVGYFKVGCLFLFLCVGVMYDRLHSRQIADYGGVVNTMPTFAAFMVLFCMANAGLPGTSRFVGEFMVILSSFKGGFSIAFLRRRPR